MKTPNLIRHKYKPLALASAISMAVFGNAAMADDIEVYVTTPVTVSPNILFILDESGSMGWDANGNSIPDTNPNQRMYQLRNAMRKLISDPSMDNVTAAILGYRRSGRIILTVHSDFVKLTDKTGDKFNRDILLDDVIGDAHLGGPNRGTLVHSGWTPSSPALKKGMDWYRGLTDESSPTDNWCEPNYMIFLTDGSPNANGLTTYDGIDCRINETVDHDWEDMQGGANDTTGGRCSATIAEWGYNHNLPDTGTPPWQDWRTGNIDLDKAYFNKSKKHYRNVITHTIGFLAPPGSAREEYLIDIADRSMDLNHPSYNFDNSYGEDLSDYDPNDPYTGGKYVRAGNEDELLAALKSFVDQANQEIDYTYTAPTIPFNADNAAISGEEMYLPLFKPDTTILWKGNIKKYNVKYDQVSNKLLILAQGPKSAIDDQLHFVSSADLWNDTGQNDGADSLAGGANSNMNSARNLYTYIEGNDPDLTIADNRVHADNDKITASMLDVANEDRAKVLHWANWLEEDGTTLRSGEDAPKMGAPLHTQPVTVRYQDAADLVLINTTEGIVHALDAVSGQEVWAYMPDELLKTIDIVRSDIESDLPMYGLDGPMTVYRTDTIYQDDDNDGIPDKDGDGKEIIKVPGHTFLVVGMRRGFTRGEESGHVTRNYYALDITEREAPRFAWEIKGGVTAGFSRLGQTWSKPIFTKLEIEGSDAQDVLIFGGGYDPDQDDATAQTDDDQGNVIYIVNPKTGALIESIDSTDMEKGKMGNAIASDVLTVDINANGVTDRLYAADVGGRIIRVDIPDKALAQVTGSSDIRGSIVANVGGEGKGDGKLQRFFNTPEVAYYKRGGTQFLALLIGSGNRPNPVDESVTDRFYMIKDPNVWIAPSEYPDVITEDDLYDSTANLVQEGSDDQQATALQEIQSKGGWYVDLDTGEKVFSEARVYDYAVLFTAYKGTKTEPDVCTATAVEGESFLYVLDMKHGGARFSADGDMFQQGNTTNLTKLDRKVSLQIPGMPPSPTLMFPAGDGSEGNDEGAPSGWVLALVGLQAPAKWPDKYHPISWEEKTDGKMSCPAP